MFRPGRVSAPAPHVHPILSTNLHTPRTRPDASTASNHPVCNRCGHRYTAAVAALEAAVDSAKAAGEALVRQAEAHLAAVEAAAQKFVDDAAQALTAVGDGISDLAGKIASSVVGWTSELFSGFAFGG